MKNLCRNCKYWTIPKQFTDCLSNYPEDMPVDKWWLDGVCSRLNAHPTAVYIATYGGWNGSGVDYIETDANFGCVLFESRE